jgi:predicted membrane channel-forming protein YqfA (hemolysin III family)
VLGPTGHIERFSAWSHWIGAVAFAVYAALRSVLLESESTAGQLATAAAITVVFTLSSSGLYHSTAPDAGLSTWSRFLDYAAIYVGLVVTSVADIAVSTRGFLNVPVETVIDIPIAGTVMLLFFLWRRWLTDPKASWGDDTRRANTECSIGMGLFRRQHFDLHHTQLRYATSFLLAVGYFAWVPAAFLSFDAPQAGLIVGLQAAGFAMLSLGMFIDRVLEWPDAPLVRGDAMAMRCAPCGCVANAHGIWHIVAIVSILLTTAAREYGLAIS